MSINSLLNQAVTIQIKTTRSRYGDAAFTGNISTTARVELCTKTIMGPNKELTPIDAIIFLRADETISAEDKITHNTIDYRVIKKDVMVDGRGRTRHIEVKAQKWR